MDRLTRFSFYHPTAVLLVLASATLFLAAGVPRVQTAFGYRVLIGDDHPSIRALDSLVQRFAGGNPVQIVWSCGAGQPCETVFDRESLEMAHVVTEALAASDGVRDVKGLANAALLVPDANGFAVRRLVENGAPAADVEELARRALEDPLWVGKLLSEDARVGVIVIQPTDNRSETDLKVVASIEEAIAPFERRGFQYQLGGDPVASVVSGRELADSTSQLIPFTVIVIGIILQALSRCWRTVAVFLGTMGIGLVWAFGLLGWLGWPQDGILEVLAPLILVVGVCDAVHLLARYRTGVASHPARSRAERSAVLLAVARDIEPACLVTTLTTAAAFLSFATSALDTLVRFGVISAFGVMSCFVLTFTLLPLPAREISATAVHAERTASAWDGFLDAVVRTSERQAGAILCGGAILLVVCGVGWASRLEVGVDFHEFFGADSRVTRWDRFIEDHLDPSDGLEVEIALPPEVAVEDPNTLHTVSQLSTFLSHQDGIRSATSMVDLLERLNRVLHGDDPAFERIGHTRAENAEILELMDFEDPGMLSSWLNLDRSRLRISAPAENQSLQERLRLLDSARAYVERALPGDWAVVFTGVLSVGVDWVTAVQNTQLRSFPTAFALVFAMVAIFLGSVRLGLAAMIPTLLPVVVTLGLMGWLGMTLDVGRAMVAAVLIGVAVDDSIHLLSQYQRRRKLGDDPGEAMRRAVRHVGRAVVTTSFALALGFLTLMMSAWATISSFGMLMALAILGALAAALLVLPALVFAFQPLGRSAESRSPLAPGLD